MAKKTSKTSGAVSKTGVVNELLSLGITVPKEISQLAKEKYNLDITPGYVSIIKSKKNSLLKPKRSAAKGTPATESVSSNGMEVENAALKLALRAGGIENAIKLLRKLQG